MTTTTTSSSPRFRSISQPYDPRSTLGITSSSISTTTNVPSRKLPPTPLNLTPSPRGTHTRVYTQAEPTDTPRTGSTYSSSSSHHHYYHPYTGTSDDDDSFRLYTPRTPEIRIQDRSIGFPSPALSSVSSLMGGTSGGGSYPRERMSSSGSMYASPTTTTTTRGGKSPVKVMFAEEMVSKVHTPKSSTSSVSASAVGGNKIKGFFGGWKKKTQSSSVSNSNVNASSTSNSAMGESESTRSSLSLGRFGQQQPPPPKGDRSPVFGSPGPVPSSEMGERFGSSHHPFPSPSTSLGGSVYREGQRYDLRNENREREVQSMYLPQQIEPRSAFSSSSSGTYDHRSVEPIYPRPAPRSARSVNETNVAPPVEFPRQRRRTTSGLTHLDPMGSRSVSSPSPSSTMTPTNHRKTSVVQRSESSFSVHSESGVETWCESPSYFPSSRSSEDDSHEDAVEDDEEAERARIGVHRGTTFADLAKKRQLVDQNPRISIVLPGSSFNLGLDFGLSASEESTKRGGPSLASMIEDEENPSASASLPGVQKQTELDARIVKTGLNPTTPVFRTGWDESVRHTASVGRTVTRSSTRSSRKSGSRNRASPPSVQSPAETVPGTASPGIVTPRVTVGPSTARPALAPSPSSETSLPAPQLGQMPPIISLNSPAEFPSNPTVLKKRSSTRRSSSGSSNQIQRSQSIMLDSPTLPVSPYRKVEPVEQVNNEAFEDPIAERPVRRSSLLRDGWNTHSLAEREVLAQGPTSLRRQPTRRRMKSSGSIASLLSITFGTDEAADKTGDDLPMFRVIPATPVGNTDAFEARPRSTDGQELASAYKATPRTLDQAVELESTPVIREPSMTALANSALPPLPEVRPLNIRAAPHRLAGRSVSSEGRLEQTSSVSTSPQFPSLTSMTTASSNTSLATFEDHDQALQQLLAEFSELHESPGNGAYANHADPLKQIKAELDEEIRSWSSMSLESLSGSPDAEALGSAMHGLGFGIQDDRSPTPIGRIQPLRSKVDKADVAEEETTPRPDRYSNGFSETRLWQDRRTSELSSASTNSAVSSFDSSDSMTDTDLDSILSDIEDLQSASIAVVASKTSAKYASPRQVEMIERFYQDEAREEVVVEEDDSAGRWDNAEEDEFEIGWAM